jgi:hypothetical protein
MVTADAQYSRPTAPQLHIAGGLLGLLARPALHRPYACSGIKAAAMRPLTASETAPAAFNRESMSAPVTLLMFAGPISFRYTAMRS